MLSAGSTRWGRTGFRTVENLPRAVLTQRRHASYSKTPMKKDGSFESLIYNDALFRNKLHVLDQKLIGAPETWKLTAGDLKKTNKNKEEEQFPLPNHAYPFYPTPFTGSNGKYVQQRIEYENILPRCKGKLSVLEWGEVSEEDRYTSRNLFIRTHNKTVSETQHMHREDAGEHERNPWSILFYFAIYYLMFHAGMPWDNNRTAWGMNVDDMYDIGLKTNPLWTTPVLGEFWGFFHFGHAQKHLQYHEQYKYPLWTEAETGVKSVLQDASNWRELSAVVPQFAGEIRENGLVKPLPTKHFRDSHELYYDGAVGPDRIGAYNVKQWRTGEPLKYATESYEISTSGIFHNGPGTQWGM